jgi:alkylation response protein AidB-like acyl-CoA dehydrogenase
MDYLLTDEQNQFRDIVRRFVEDKSPGIAVRQQMATDTGYDAAVWQSLSQDLGLSGIVVPEAYGGQGFSDIELGIVMEEMGRGLLCSPFFSSSVLSGSAIEFTGSEDDKQALLPGIADGSQRWALAILEPGGDCDITEITTTATPTADGYKLSGTKGYVIDGHGAEQLLVVARLVGSVGGEGIGAFRVDGDASGMQRELLNTIDSSRKQATVILHNVHGIAVGEPGNVLDGIHKTLQRVFVALAGEMVGGAEKMLYSAVEYTSNRRQFGRLIGSFQALKHKCADLLMEVELARSAAFTASSALAERNEHASVYASMAKSAAADAFMHAAAACIQLHGGIGFTWDHDTHLWYKRAKTSEVLFGDPYWHREHVVAAWSDEI